MAARGGPAKPPTNRYKQFLKLRDGSSRGPAQPAERLKCEAMRFLQHPDSFFASFFVTEITYLGPMPTSATRIQQLRHWKFQPRFCRQKISPTGNFYAASATATGARTRPACRAGPSGISRHPRATARRAGQARQGGHAAITHAAAAAAAAAAADHPSRGRERARRWPRGRTGPGSGPGPRPAPAAAAPASPPPALCRRRRRDVVPRGTTRIRVCVCARARMHARVPLAAAPGTTRTRACVCVCVCVCMRVCVCAPSETLSRMQHCLECPLPPHAPCHRAQ